MSKKPNILVVGPWYPAGPLRDIADAFERMGFGVFRVGPTFNKHMDIDWGVDEIYPDIPLQPASFWGLDALVDYSTRSGLVPDLVLVMDEYNNSVTPTDKVPVALWSLDGWPENYERRNLYNPTIALTNHPYGIRKFPQESTPEGWSYLPGAAAPWKHKDLGLERDIDFSLMATMYCARPIICTYLRQCGVSVRNGQVSTGEYVNTYNRSLATYCNTNENGHEIKWRFWETSAMGCINLCDDGFLLRKLGYFQWEHYVPVELDGNWGEEKWPTGQEIFKTLKFLQTEPALARFISRRAKGKTIAEHTYYDRAKTVLNDLGLGHLKELADEAKRRDLLPLK